MDKSPILYIIHAGKGGTRYTSLDLIREVSKFRPAFLLITGYTDWTLEKWENGQSIPLSRRYFSTLWMVSYPPNKKRTEAVLKIIETFGITLVHIRQFIGNYPEWVQLFKDKSLRVFLSLHDFYLACPTIQLIDYTGRYCGGDCSRHQRDQAGSNIVPYFATADGKDCMAAYFPRDRRLKENYINDWRKRTEQALGAADHVITTSQSTRDFYLEWFPVLDRSKITIIPHGRDFPKLSPLSAPPRPDSKIRIVCFGGLAPPKGTFIFEQFLKINRKRGNPFQFHFLGDRHAVFDPTQYGGIWHGLYDRSSLFDFLGKIRPSLSLIFSIWPETWCHTLTESWAAKIPVAVLKYGALAERVSQCGGGWILEHETPEILFDKLMEICQNRQEYHKALAQIENIPQPTCQQMASAYLEIYQGKPESPASQGT